MLLMRLFDGLSQSVRTACFNFDAVILPALCRNQTLEADCFLVSRSTELMRLGVRSWNLNSCMHPLTLLVKVTVMLMICSREVLLEVHLLLI